jgi:hypothetical protein
MTKYLVDLYQTFIEKKDKNIKTNFTLQQSLCDDNDDDDTNPKNANVDITHLDLANFFEHPEGKIDHLIGNDSV